MKTGKLQKIYPTTITDMLEQKESVKEFGLNLCKIPEYARTKSLALEAIKENPFAILFCSPELAKDQDIKNYVLYSKEYLKKYVDPLLDTNGIEIGPLTEREIKKIIVRNDHTFEKELNLKEASIEKEI